MVKSIDELTTAYTKLYNEYIKELNELAQKSENKADADLLKAYKPLINNYIYIKFMCDPSIDADDNVPKVKIVF